MSELVKVKVSELDGAALDWAVARIEQIETKPGMYYETRDVCPLTGEWEENIWSPSADWAQGGPLIEKHVFRIEQTGTHTWLACSYHSVGGQWLHQLGETALVAAMRVAVAAELGDTVEVPKELVT